MCLIAGLVVSPAHAIDGRVQVQNTVQSGQAGANAYSQNNLVSDAQAGQLIPFGQVLRLRLNGRYYREDLNNRVGTFRSDLLRNTGQGTVMLDAGARRFRFSLFGDGFDRRTAGIGAGERRLMRQQVGSSADFNRLWLRVNLSGIFTNSHRENLAGPDSKNQEWAGSVNTRTAIPKLGDLGYRFSTLVDRDNTSNLTGSQNTHTLTFSGDSRFAGNRGSASLKTVSSRFSQSQDWRTGTQGEQIRLPLTGGYRLDDTPEVADPLESPFVQVSGLYDGNRSAGTEINIGDSAPAVREFGGDYRNIQYDFGEAIDLSSAILYVDAPLVTPALFRWRVYTSNDPEGQVWTEVPATGVQVVYKEWGTGLQGWTASLSSPISARFFKMVDVKLGPTIADLHVTELEVYTKAEATQGHEHSQTDNHRVTAGLGYDFSPTVHAGYDLSWNRRTMPLRATPLVQQAHGFSAGWRPGPWQLAGRYEIRKLGGRMSGDTDSRSQNVGLRHGRTGPLVLDLGWERVTDQGAQIDKLSHNVSAGASWAAAPALQIRPRVSVARLTDRLRGITSRALAVTTTATGEPVRTVTLDLDWSDRWVSEQAGAGFTRFSSMALNLGWRPAPYFSIESQARYELRNRGDWITRNTVSWAPLSEGTLKLRLNASHYRETRTQQTQKSGGAQMEWEARSDLTLVSGVEYLVYEAAGQKNTPVNVELRGNWRF